MAAALACLLLLVLVNNFVADTLGESADVDEVRCDVMGCFYDMNLYCLTTGQLVMGSCKLKERLCTGGVRNSLGILDVSECLSPENIINVHEPEDGQMR